MSDNSLIVKADYDIIGKPVRSAIQMLSALAWVPEGEVVEAYHIIKPTLSSDLAEFIQYFEEILIGTPTSPTRYRPSQWNQYKAILSIICRSSNVVEGWHSSFYNLVECYHPSTFSSRPCSPNRHSHQSRFLLITRNACQLRDARSSSALRSARMTNAKLMILKRKTYEKET